MSLSRVVIFLSLFFVATSISAQSTTYSVQGKVNSETGDPIEMGNVIALSSKDSSLLKGNFFMDGSYLLEGIPTQQFILKITSLGFSDTFVPVDVATNETVKTISPLTLSLDNTLEEFEIVAKIATFEHKPGKTIVNVANTTLVQMVDLEAILNKSPRMKVSNGQVSMLGKGNALIYVDGKRVSYEEADLIPTSEIKSIDAAIGEQIRIGTQNSGAMSSADKIIL